MNHIFYIMGKSSSGKDTIYKMLLEKGDFFPIVLYTTRPMRESEKDGREYHFTDLSGYEEKLALGDVIEKRIYKTIYGEWIYFTCKDNIDLEKGNYLGIGTLDSFKKINAFFGDERVIPLYVEVDDGIRLIRAIQREMHEEEPKYIELCRRFIADSRDFSDEKLSKANIERKFSNNSTLEKCVSDIEEYIRSLL